MKNLLIFLGLLAVIFIGIFIFKQFGSGSDSEAAASGRSWGSKKGIKVRVEKVSLRDISETVTASGKLYPEKEVTISPEISGEIVELLVEDGDSVKAGQKLLEIDPEIYVSDVRKMEAALSGAKAAHSSAKAGRIRAEQGLKNSELQYNRAKSLFEQGVTSQADFENAEMTYESAKADVSIAEENVNSAWYSVQSNQQNLRQMQENLSRTKILAPVAGIVSGLKVKQGETVLGTSMMSGTELMKIVDLKGMRVKVDVSESDVLRIAPGDTAWIEVDAYLDRKFQGKVIRVATSATTDQFASADQATNFLVEIVLSAKDYGALMKEEGRSRYPLFPGMSATAEIKTRTVQDALTVPIQAVTTREDSTSNTGKDLKEVVFVSSGGIALEKVVQTGLQNEDYIEVREGLEEDMDVISGPYRAISRELSDSVRIQIEEKKKN